MTESIQMTKIPALRSEYLILNSAGINIICRIGYLILQEKARLEQMDFYIDGLSKIDWKKNAAIWQGSIIQVNEKGGFKIATSNSTMKEAVKKVKQLIQLDDEQ